MHVPFHCPVCGSDGLQMVVVKRAAGVPRTTEAYDARTLKSRKEEAGNTIYWLDAPKAANKIHVIPLKEIFEVRLGLKFVKQSAI